MSLKHKSHFRPLIYYYLFSTFSLYLPKQWNIWQNDGSRDQFVNDKINTRALILNILQSVSVYFSLISDHLLVIADGIFMQIKLSFYFYLHCPLPDGDPPELFITHNFTFVLFCFVLFYFIVFHFSRSHLQLPAGKCDQSPADGVNAAIRI